MRPFLLAACLAMLLGTPLATAGTARSPEIADGARDADPANALDLTGVYIDTPRADSVAFHFKTYRPAPSQDAGACGPDCLTFALAFTVEFVALTPNGTLAPKLADYAATQVTFRAGGPAALRGTVAYLNTTGWAHNVTTVPVQESGGEVVLTVPRAHVGMGIPALLAPGAYRLTGLFAHSAPQLCHPEVEDPSETVAPVPACTPLPRPVAMGAAVEAKPHWDRAPDIGHGLDFVFPSPRVESPATPEPVPPPASPAPSPPPPTPPSTTQPAAPPPPSKPPTTTTTTTAPTTSATEPPAPSSSSTSSSTKASPTPAVGAALALLGALAARRRLTA